MSTDPSETADGDFWIFGYGFVLPFRHDRLLPTNTDTAPPQKSDMEANTRPEWPAQLRYAPPIPFLSCTIQTN